MYSLVASACLLTLTVLLASSYAYPYKNNYHEARDNFDPKDVRNLDGIDASKLSQDSKVEKREVHFLTGYTPSYPATGTAYQSSNSMSQLDGIGGGNLIRELESGEGVLDDLLVVPPETLVNWCTPNGVWPSSDACDLVFFILTNGGRVIDGKTFLQNQQSDEENIQPEEDRVYSFSDPDEMGSMEGNQNNEINTHESTSYGAYSQQNPSSKSHEVIVTPFKTNRRELDSIGGANLLRNLKYARDLDLFGDGNLIRSLPNRYTRDLDSLGGENLLRSLAYNYTRDLDSLGGGNLLRSLPSKYIRELDALGGGNLLRSTAYKTRDLDALGGGNLLRSTAYKTRDLDALGGGNLLRSLSSKYTRELDALGGGNLLRSTAYNPRDLDALGGGNLLRSLSSKYTRELDALGGGNLLRSTAYKTRDLDALGGGNLLRSLPSKYTRELDALGGGNLLRSMTNNYS